LSIDGEKNNKTPAPEVTRAKEEDEMTSKERKEKIKPNAVFMVGGKLYRIIKVEGGNAIVQGKDNGNRMNYGVDALSRLNITFCNL
jgi:hypothetical protein